MKIRVEYTGQLRTAADRAADEIEVAGGTPLLALFSQLAKRLGEAAAPHLITSAGGVPTGLLVVVNNAALPPESVSTMLLHDGDVLTLLPPIAGG